jgi:hypothetical protein
MFAYYQENYVSSSGSGEKSPIVALSSIDQCKGVMMFTRKNNITLDNSKM